MKFILKKSADFDITAPYDNNYVFMYFSNSWVYSSSLDDAPSYNNSLPEKQNKATHYHYVAAGDSVAVFFNYSQIKLVEAQEYTVYVMASRCDYDYASELVVSRVEDIYPEMKQVHPAQVVYQSDFSMVHYSDVKYDPGDTSNGVLPFSSYEDISKYHLSYNAKEDADGKIDYTGKDVYSDKNSWYYDPASWKGPGTHDSSNSSDLDLSVSSVSSSFSNLSRSFSGFFSFVNSTLNFFPSSFKVILSLGLTSIVVLALFKAVFR